MYPVIFRIGSFAIYSYGVLVAIGCVVAYLYIHRETVRAGLDVQKMTNLFLWVLVSGFLGGRALYIGVEWRSFLREPWRVIFSRGGFVFYGGVILGFVTGFWQAKRNNLSMWKVSDIFAPAVTLAHAIGRIGCFLNGCCYGIPTNSWWGVRFHPDSLAGATGESLLPIQLFSSFALFVIFVILLKVKEFKKFDGQVFWLYVFLYGVTRSIIEVFRGDPRGHIWIFSVSQFIGIISAIFSLLMILKLARRPIRGG